MTSYSSNLHSHPLSIGLDVRMWAESGIGRYVRNIVHALVLIDSFHSYTLFGLSKDADSICSVISRSSSQWHFVPVDFRWYSFSEQVFFLQKLLSVPLDIMHFPHFNVPFFYSKPFVVTIHDLTHFTFFMHRASTLSPLLYRAKHFAYQSIFHHAVFDSAHVITVSEYVKGELYERFGLQQDKVTVLYEAVDPSFQAIQPRIVDGIASPYFFYVGNAHPHKNLEFLLLAFSLFLQKHPSYYLVLAGRRHYFWDRLRAYASDSHLDTHVYFLDFVSDAELAYLYSHADAYVFPSLSEGFGLPLLEAMFFRCPVVCSRVTCLPEIAGDAALYFDPHDVIDCVSQLESVAFDSSLRFALISRGAERCSQFRWENHVRGLLNIYSRSF